MADIVFSRDQGWDVPSSEAAEAETAENFATRIVETADFSTGDLPFGPKPHPYAYWTKQLLWLISDDIVGRKRRYTDWKGAETVINAAKRGLATDLRNWREDRKTQLSEERYARLGFAEAEAWLQWLRIFRKRVKAVSEHCRNSSGVNAKILRAWEVIVSCWLALDF